MTALPAGCAAGRPHSLQPEVGTKFVPPKLVRTFMGESAYSAARETLLQQQAAHMHQLSELHRLVGVQRQLTQQLSFGGGSSAGERMRQWNPQAQQALHLAAAVRPCVRRWRHCAHCVQLPTAMLPGTENLALTPWVQQSKLSVTCPSAGLELPSALSPALADRLCGLPACLLHGSVL